MHRSICRLLFISQKSLQHPQKTPFIRQSSSLPPKPATTVIPHKMSSITAQLQQSPYVPETGIALSLSDDLTEEQLHSFPAFKTWINTLLKTLKSQSTDKHPYHDNPYRLHGITVQAVDRFNGDRLGFVKLKADVRTDDGQGFPGSVFLRGGSVAILIVLQEEVDSMRIKLACSQGRRPPEPMQYVILTSQPRIPAGTFAFTEIPAGMLDDSGTFAGAAAQEIKEETGLEIKEDELIDMTRLAMPASGICTDMGIMEDEVLQKAIYPSPGGSDEFIPLFLVQKMMPSTEISNLQGRLTGLREHGEKISLKVVPLEKAWEFAARDAKTLSALYLYEKLEKEGKLNAHNPEKWIKRKIHESFLTNGVGGGDEHGVSRKEPIGKPLSARRKRRIRGGKAFRTPEEDVVGDFSTLRDWKPQISQKPIWRNGPVGCNASDASQRKVV